MKQRMTYSEACLWMEYRRKHGGIGQARLAYLLACLATMFNRANGGEAQLHDFLPGVPEQKPVEIIDAEQMMMFWSKPA
ncbi:phage tail assembly protein T [Ferribacterium limneticum]|uniref:phage tail assembly protein T n=1 Tax=Ferribacterium limneticum TaxID=76259 RepID=UPI001CFAEC14|nr:hypothetical protein [Ferribacterium limneticum]UCV27010.1 hypothetical protein KI617_11940 [Ferribacterium limneticum]UCV30927.1 hypothetical protein KI608_11940 [Ferribacterium limneticum]